MKRTVSKIDGKTKKSQQSIQYNILEEEEKKEKKTYKSETKLFRINKMHKVG